MTLSCGAAAAHSSPVARKSEPFRLVWSSSAGCGSSRTFMAGLTGPTSVLRDARVDERAITLIVELFRAQGGVRGQLMMRKPDGELMTREVIGQDCQEVESAMALIANVMVDPLATGTDTVVVKTDPMIVRVEGASPPSRWSLRVEQRLSARTAVAPRFAWGPALGAMLTRETGDLHPSVGLSAMWAQATSSASTGSAELDWVAGRLALCPAGWQPGPSWDLRACATLQLGRLRGTGFATRAAASKAIFWGSGGVELEARYQLLGPLWAGLESEFTLPFSHERFYLEPSETLHRVPNWGVSFGLGLGLRFF